MGFLESSSEIKVWSRRHRDRILWYAYNPRTRRQVVFSDPAQLRTWLDDYDPGTGPQRVVNTWGGGQNVYPLNFRP